MNLIVFLIGTTILALTIQVTIPAAFNRDMATMNETSISFVDSGISIPEQIMNFFTRFYRVDKSYLRIAGSDSRIV